MFYPAGVAQLSIFSAEASVPAVGDLAGLLCGQGQVASFASTAARLTVEVAQVWRARLIADELAVRGVRAELTRCDSGQVMVRTSFRKDLLPLATRWAAGPARAKTVPARFRLTGSSLRLWLLAAGEWGERGYLIRFDPQSPQTHEPLTDALRLVGLPPTAPPRGADRGAEAAARVGGVRRLRRLVELVGPAPSGAEIDWPTSLRPVRAS